MTRSVDSLALRQRIFVAYLQDDAEQIARLIGPTAPQSGFERGFNLLHLAVLTGKSHILRLTIRQIGAGWESLCTRKNDEGQTPLDLATELGMDAIALELEELTNSPSGSKRLGKSPAEKVDEKRLNMPIEDEMREEQLDAFGRKSQQKLSANVRGKPYWRG